MVNHNVEIMIMSHEYEKIRERIYKEIDVGLTLLKAETGYLREDMQVICSHTV